MKINNLSEHNCIINRYLAEMRDCDYQKNRLLFRNNIKRIGEYEAFEISKTLNYENRDVTTPLGVAQVKFPTDKIVIGTMPDFLSTRVSSTSSTIQAMPL